MFLQQAQKRLFWKVEKIIHTFLGIQCCLLQEWVLPFYIGLHMNGLFTTQIQLFCLGAGWRRAITKSKIVSIIPLDIHRLGALHIAYSSVCFFINEKFKYAFDFSGILLKKQSGPIRIILDIFFIGAILTGAGVGLALSFPLLSAAISKLFNINQSLYLDFLMLFICMCVVAISVYRGLQNGIKKLSNFNIILVIIFLFLILITGPTKYIIFNTLESFSYVIKNYFSLSLTKSKYSLDWTVFYWAWYIALAPAVGAFIVNISNNKTVRELIFGAIIVGSLGCIFHIGVLSNISIYFYENAILDAPKIYEDGSLTSHALVVETISSLNFGLVFLIIFAIIAVVFLCTTYDSLSYILATASMKNFKTNPLEA